MKLIHRQAFRSLLASDDDVRRKDCDRAKPSGFLTDAERDAIEAILKAKPKKRSGKQSKGTSSVS